MTDNASASRPALLGELLLVLAPLKVAAADERYLRNLLALVGWNVDQLVGFDVADAARNLQGLVDDIEALARFGDAPPAQLADYVALLRRADKAFAHLRGLRAVLGARLPADLDDVGRDLLHTVALAAWNRFAPLSYCVAQLLTLIDPPGMGPTVPAIVDGGRTVRPEWHVGRVRLDRLGPLLRDPIAVLRDYYFGGAGLSTRAAAHDAADRLFPRLGHLFRELGLNAHYGIAPGFPVAGDPDARADFAHILTVFAIPADRDELGINLAFSSVPGMQGLFVRPFGEVGLDRELGTWHVTVKATALVGSAFIGDRVELHDGSTLALQLAAEPLPGFSGTTRLGGERGTGVQLGAARVAGGLTLGDGHDASLEVIVDKLRLQLAAADGDGFLARILPPDGLRVETAFSAGWSLHRGFHFSGSAGLAASWPLHVALGPLRIHALGLSVAASDRGVDAAATVTVGVDLGPLAVTVDEVGLAAHVEFPAEGGNLGVARLALAFKPPAGVGLALDLPAARGAGRLRVEPGRYLGGFHLDVAQRFALDLVALLETRNPGFSLVVAGIATFPAIPLGFGFELRRAGALIAIHRRLDLDALQAALQAGRLAGLIAVDPARPEQLAALGAILPVRDGTHVAGVILGVTWGHPVLAAIDLTFLYDTSAPDRLVVLGTLTSALPAEHPLLRLNVDVVGVFEASPLSIDARASLRDSSLAGMKLAGDAALQLRLGDQPRFVLSLGGFHSGFTPPADFPVLRRLELSLPHNDVVQLSLRAFFAVTASSLQFGADAHFWAGIDGVLGVEGDLQFEALVAWRPLHFEAALDVHIAVRVAGRTLFGADLRGALAGPGPWHVTGGVFITVMWWEVEVYSVDAVFGAAAVAPGLPPVDLAGEVIAALRSPRSWRSRPRADHQAVTLAGAAGDAGTPVLHPSAPLEVSQSVAPLGVALDHAGGAAITGARTIAITAPRIAGSAATTAPVVEPFAIEQFFALSDADKLSRPAFEDLPSGLRFDAAAGAVDPAVFAVPAALGFETIPAAPDRGISDALVGAEIAVNAVDVAGWQAPAHPVIVRPVQFAVATIDAPAVDTPASAGTVGAAVGFASRIEAARWLSDLRAADPARAAVLQVVPR